MDAFMDVDADVAFGEDRMIVMMVYDEFILY